MLHILEEEVSLDTLIGQKFQVVVLYFTATWCGPCKMIWPKVQELSKNQLYKDSILFIKIDVDEFEDLSSECDVNSMPTFQFYRQDQKEKFDILEGANELELTTKCTSALLN